MSRPEGRRRWFFRGQVILALAALAAVLVPLFLLEVPWPEGDRDYLADRGRAETGAQNLVSALYLGYRVFDTLGETIVLLLAVTGTVGLLRSRPSVPGRSGPSPEDDPGGERAGRRFRRKRTVLMEVVAGKLGPVLLLIGFWGILGKRNIIKKIYGLTVMNGTVVILFVLEGAQIGSRSPILTGGGSGPVADPLPQALMLTAIVIGVCITAFSLALAYRLYRAAGSFDIDEIRRVIRGEAPGEAPGEARGEKP